jgi:NTP pyrophosphatase (non-canonical NTP hydrolase)
LKLEFHDLIQRAMHIREQYSELEKSRYGRSWTDEEIALGFMGDVGDLAKLILAREGVRAIPDAEAKLAHELADCLWSVIVLSQHYGINLEQAFLGTMDEIEVHIKNTT